MKEPSDMPIIMEEAEGIKYVTLSPETTFSFVASKHMFAWETSDWNPNEDKKVTWGGELQAEEALSAWLVGPEISIVPRPKGLPRQSPSWP